MKDKLINGSVVVNNNHQSAFGERVPNGGTVSNHCDVVNHVTPEAGKQTNLMSCNGTGNCENFCVAEKQTKSCLHNDSGIHHRVVNHVDALNQSDGIEPVIGGGDQVGGATGEELETLTRLQVMTDPANLCTFCGAFLAVLALANMWRGRYYVAMAINVIANIMDIVDGPIARATPGRNHAYSLVGSKLDCYSDLVSHFVVPASLLMHIHDLAPVSVILAMLYVCSGIMRQSLFEVTPRCDEGQCIFGVTSDYMVAIYALTMHLRPFVPPGLLPHILSACVVLMIFLCLTFSLRSRRYSGFGLVTVTIFNLLLCGSCGLLAVLEGNEATAALVTLPVLLLLAYPCYFRFVEVYR